MSTLDADQVIKSFKDNITGFVHLDKINFVLIFGSLSTGRDHNWSDIDICVSISNYNKLPSSQRFEIAAELLTHFEKTVSSDLIDLSIWEVLNPNLRFNVLKSGKVIFQKSTRYFQEITAHTMKIYWDQKEWHDKLVDAVFIGDLQIIDEKIVKEKFILTNKYLDKMKDIVDNYTIDEFKRNTDKQIIAERCFEVVCISIIDVCTIIMSSQSELPGSYAECMDILGAKEIIPRPLAERLANAVRMRNFIVHQYEKIDYELLYNSLRALLDDFYEFKEAISGWMATNIDEIK